MTRTYNLTASNSLTDLTTRLTMAAGNDTFDLAVSQFASASIQVTWINGDVADGTFKLYCSENGINWSIYPNANTITSTISGSDTTDGWQTSLFKSAYMRVAFTKGTNTTGTYLILTTLNTEE